MVIVGGGPGGAAAAIEASRSGLDVIVVDKASFPRDKCCGDGLTTGALRQLEELGLDPASVASWRTIEDVYVRTPSGQQKLFPLPSPHRPGTGAGVFAAVARRRDLDAALLALAADQGAAVFQQHTLVDLTQTDRAVTATVDGVGGRVTIEAKHLIAADGMWSPTRKLLGIDIDNYRGDWHAFRQYFNNVSGAANRDLLVWFEPELLPGYAWSFPVGDNTANVGFGILRQPGQSVQVMKDLWPRILARPHIVEALGPQAEPESTHRAWPIPARLGQLPFSEGRVLFVGDALAAADPMTGEGIGQAIETGRMAANAVSAGNVDRDPTVISDRYESELRAGMMKDHRLANLLSAALRSPRRVDAAVSIAGVSAWTRKNFARWLFEDYPRAALATPRRWQRGLLNSPGAFGNASR